MGKFQKRPAYTILSLMILSGVVLSGCGAGSSGGAASGDSGSAKNQADIVIGHIGPQSGNLASLGQWDTKGIQLAFDEVNEKGGIKGRKLVLQKLDDQGNPTISVNNANKLVSDKVVAAFATPSSTSTLAVIPVFEQAKIPHMTPGQDPNLTKKGSKYVFRYTASSLVLDETVAEYAVNKLNLKKIALITNTGAYGKGEHDSFLAAIKAKGVTPVADETVTPDAKDFSAQLTKIKEAKPEALFIGAEEIESGLIAKQAKALGMDVKFLGSASLGTPIYRDSAGNDVADQTFYSTTYISNDATAETKAFADAYQKKYGEVPEAHGAKAYDGAKMLIEVLNKIYPNIESGKIRDALSQLSYHGITGDFKFDETGEGLKSSLLGTFKNGQPTPITK
jgi:branched-chain amino acid transport system substrate-binding protein